MCVSFITAGPWSADVSGDTCVMTNASAKSSACYCSNEDGWLHNDNRYYSAHEYVTND